MDKPETRTKAMCVPVSSNVNMQDQKVRNPIFCKITAGAHDPSFNYQANGKPPGSFFYITDSSLWLSIYRFK